MPKGELTVQPQIFVDLQDINRRENVRRVFHSATKHGRHPVLTQTEAWEKHSGMTASVIFDAEEKKFKAWYMAGTYIGEKSQHVQCIALSEDGIHWEKPALGLNSFDGSKENNIVIPASYHDGQDHWETMLKDSTSNNPEMLYKALGWSSYDWSGPLSGIYSAWSGDGLNWSHNAEPIFHHHPRVGSEDIGPIGDAQSMMVDSRRGRYVAFLRDGMDRSMSVSEDFVNWSHPQKFLYQQNEEEGLYNNTGFVYGDQYLGFLTRFDRRAFEQTQSLCLLASRDGDAWTRPDGPPLIEPGDVGQWDRNQIMLTGAPPIKVDSSLYIYYRGTARKHNKVIGEFDPSIDADQDKGTMSIGLATLRLDGFASIEASFDVGYFTTTVWRLSGDELSLNVISDYGEVTLELQNEEFTPIEKFTRDDSVPILADSVDAMVRWKDGRSIRELGDRPVRIRFFLKNAALFSYSVR